jgi:Tol biopolymer transport system component
MTQRHAFAFAIAALLLAVAAVAAQSGYDLFAQAQIRVEEENYQEAIRLFERVVKENETSNRSLVAKALVQLGRAYEKTKDKDKARAAYERVAAGFSAEADAFEAARRRLAELNVGSEPAVLRQRVAAYGKANPRTSWNPFITADGRFMALTGFGIVIRDLLLGETEQMMERPEEVLRYVRGLPEPPSRADRALEAKLERNGLMAEQVIMSPDKKWLAFFQSEPGQRCCFDDGFVTEIRVMPNRAGAESRVILSGRDVSYLFGGWSADGKSILVLIHREDDAYDLSWVSTEKKNDVRKLRSLGWRMSFPFGDPGLPRLSPDGRHIVYSALPTDPGIPDGQDTIKKSAAPRHLYVIRADSPGPETDIVSGNSINESPLWLPDGSGVLFVSNRSGAGFGLHTVGVKDGQVTDPIAPVKSSVVTGRVLPIALTENGSLYYSPVSQSGTRLGWESEDVFVAPIDAASGKASGPLLRPISNDADRNGFPSWSPDGRSLALMRNRKEANPDDDKAVALIVYDMQTANEREYVFPHLDERTMPVWYPDGKHIIVRRTYRADGQLYKVDLGTHEFKRIEATERSLPFPGIRDMAFSHDGGTLYLMRHFTARPPERRERFSLVALNLETAEQREIWSSPHEGINPFFALSPDGRTLAISHGFKLDTIDVDGSHRTEIAPSFHASTSIAWAADGKHIYFVGGPGDTRDAEKLALSESALAGLTELPTFNSRLMRIPAQGGPPEPGVEMSGRASFIDVSPDGSRIAFSQTTAVLDRNLYVVDNFTSIIKSPEIG